MNDDVVRVELTDSARTDLAQRAELVLPRLIVDAGPAAVEKFLEFFAARIANRRTRAAYGPGAEARGDDGRNAGARAGRGPPAPRGDRHGHARLAGLRDRALVSVMLYSFARVSAVIGMRRQDYFRQERQGWLRLHEKGGTRYDVPRPAIGRPRRSTTTSSGPGALAASRPGDDQAAGGGGGSPALDLLPHVPGDGDHGVSVELGDARTRAADRRARLPEDDEALYDRTVDTITVAEIERIVI